MSETDRIIGAIQATQEQLEKRLDGLEVKVDQLATFRARVLGIKDLAVVVGSGLVSLGVALIVNFWRHA